MFGRIGTIFFSSFLLITGCRSGTVVQEGRAWDEAAQVRAEALSLAKEIEPPLAELVRQKYSILVQSRALDNEDATFIEQVESLEKDFDRWSRQIRMGNPRLGSPEWEERDFKPGPEEWLRIQREFLADMQRIRKEVMVLGKE